MLKWSLSNPWLVLLIEHLQENFKNKRSWFKWELLDKEIVGNLLVENTKEVSSLSKGHFPVV